MDADGNVCDLALIHKSYCSKYNYSILFSRGLKYECLVSHLSLVYVSSLYFSTDIPSG